MVGLRDQLHKKELVLEERAGWSYPRSKSGETRSYSCRRLPFWTEGSLGGPVLLVPRLEGEQTATEARFAGMLTMGEEGDRLCTGIRIIRCTISKVFHISRHVLHCTTSCCCCVAHASHRRRHHQAVNCPASLGCIGQEREEVGCARHHIANGSSALVTFIPA
ncbi:hypothetical protein BGZ60DRAFT_61247 [Tricladium varicosporioides]|nr:hypothetical protein BGZ60DRAFT_61247 [Hymenoscyphus varicosporioides]